jgi:hypothetical protein
MMFHIPRWLGADDCLGEVNLPAVAEGPAESSVLAAHAPSILSHTSLLLLIPIQHNYLYFMPNEVGGLYA